MKNDFDKDIGNLVISKDFAVGNDVVFLPDFKASFNPLFKNKIFTTEEVAYCEQFENPMLRYASTWASKEAVYKAIKQIIPSPISFKKIEISRSKVAGIPTIKLPDLYNKFNFSLSISHDGDYVWAFVILKIEDK
ncbi:4-phosphopantetheinyl transferase [Pedobacter psychrophilus]|uniref:4-phosphopantetheinyl transferase n=1 Tax=Pedobacter psychrophilus TaxID=1826909 RepID=A0A179DLH6_9SPHI|nr:holo-ACP synthase [Pedobacter psychrophilus]OAQ41724.1 4-phosphopantetheinyl transferase [Pedobacter psychrophilus]